jgi:hypothetical protein
MIALLARCEEGVHIDMDDLSDRRLFHACSATAGSREPQAVALRPSLC